MPDRNDTIATDRDNYSFVDKLGEGGFGKVYLAADRLVPGRLVAVKVLKDSRPEYRKELISEMRLLSDLNHPAVVTLYHHFDFQDKLHLVMEFCAGGSLRRRMVTQSQVEIDKVFRWGSALAEVLAFVHARGVVHHDIKPDNILFTEDNRIKIGDFGVANTNGGTLRYMAPELLSGDSRTSRDPRVDIYALGITLLELVLGMNPFDGLADSEIRRRKIEGNIVPNSILPWVREILTRATHPDPNLRFQDMCSFGEAIDSRTAPYIVDDKQIRAHELSVKAERLIARRRWTKAWSLISEAIDTDNQSVSALVAAGRYMIQVRDLEEAKRYFEMVLRINPRANIQKELGRINLEFGEHAVAISMLTDYLQRNPVDWEAHNLLAHGFYSINRFDASERITKNAFHKAKCFANNHLISLILSSGMSKERLKNIPDTFRNDPFFCYNNTVAQEEGDSWDTSSRVPLKSKLLFEDYRFSSKQSIVSNNSVVIQVGDSDETTYTDHLISIGRFDTNKIVLRENDISRRHCVLVNYPGDVWIYDLKSATRTYIDGKAIREKAFVLGLHIVDVGRYSIKVKSNADLLI